MPVDKSKYPPNWASEIRPRIIERDGHKCKFCGVPNHAVGWRDYRGEWNKLSEGHLGDMETEFAQESGYKVIKIVLTIAHLDQNTKNNNDENLAALCQKCHLNHDKSQHILNARKTREIKQGLQRLF
jgi:5-methylcytosine-specific restriction endonuclease McrA